jgi:hypothetical protein
MAVAKFSQEEFKVAVNMLSSAQRVLLQAALKEVMSSPVTPQLFDVRGLVDDAGNNHGDQFRQSKKIDLTRYKRP